MPRIPTPKYRPSLSAEEVEHILLLAKQSYLDDDHPETKSLDISIIGKFDVLKTKIENNAISASHVEKGKVSIEESIGLELPTNKQTKEEYWEACYIKFQADPTSCTLQEIAAKDEYCYLNELMSPREIEIFESNITMPKESI